MKNVLITVEGNVIKRGFRWGAMEIAYKLGIRGYAKYLKPRSVLIEAEGDEEALIQFIGWCEKGPLGAQVERIQIREGEVKGFTSFDMH